MTSNVFGTMNGQVCAGGTTAMVGLATLLGAGDLELGLLVAIPQIATLLQIPFAALVNRTGKRKLYILTMGVLCRVFWLFFGFLPLLEQPGASQLPLTLLIVLLTVSSALGAVISVCWYPWFSDLAPLEIRGRWLSIRDVMVSAASILFCLLIAYLLDTLPFDSKYLVVFLIGGATGVIDLCCYYFVKNVPIQTDPSKHKKSAAISALHNKTFMKFAMMWTSWCFTANMSGSYLTPYAMNEMGLSFMQVMLFGTITSLFATVLVVKFWGRNIDSYGSRNVMMLSCVVASFTPLFFLMAKPGSIWPVFLHNLIGAAFWCGSNLAMNSLQLSATPTQSRPTYIAMFACCSGLGTALGTMCGGWFLDMSARNGWFTAGPDRYQVLIIISVILRILFVLLLVPSLHSEKDVSLRDMVRRMFSHA